MDSKHGIRFCKFTKVFCKISYNKYKENICFCSNSSRLEKKNGKIEMNFNKDTADKEIVTTVSNNKTNRILLVTGYPKIRSETNIECFILPL